jgi:hypothetical protein
VLDMNFLEKLRQRKDEITASVAETIGHILVTDEIKQQRLVICNSCEFLFTPTMQCKKCGCFVNAKTSVARFECPIQKWTKIEVVK